MKSRILYLLLLLQITVNLLSQIDYENTDFASPLDIDIQLSSNFGELRKNHFHSGLDIRTNGKINANIYSIEYGYVSRIAISNKGYGKVLYIDHPNGYTSVYAHLNRFSDKIENWIDTELENIQSEYFDINLNPNDIIVSKSEFVAYSGNTGSSSGPHLHFEIRETKSEKPVNPFLFGLFQSDNVKPQIFGIKLYPLDDTSNVMSQNNPKYFQLNKDGFLIDSIVCYGNIGVAINTRDIINKSNVDGAPYQIIMKKNFENYTITKFHKLDFAKKRLINNYTDYYMYTSKRMNIHKSFIDGFNDLENFTYIKNNGVINIDDSITTIEYVVSDFFDNKNILYFKIYKGEKIEFPKIEFENKIHCGEKNVFVNDNIKVIFNKNSLFWDLDFKYSRIATTKYYSDIHKFSDNKTIINDKIKYKIIPTKYIAKELKDKIIAINPYNKASLGGKFINDTFEIELINFQNITLELDTTSPTINILNSDKMLSKLNIKSNIFFSVNDNISGIKSVKAFVDDNWLVTNYSRGRYKVNLGNWKEYSTGIHKLRIESIDNCSNKSEKIIELNIY